MRINKLRANKAIDAFHSVVDRVNSIKGSGEINDVLREAINIYGLKNIAYVGFNVSRSDPRTPFYSVTYKNDWIERYQEEAYSAIDPVLSHGMRSILPVDWSVFDRTPTKLQKFFSEAAEIGVGRQGITIPVRGRSGDVALFSMTSDLSNEDWREFKRAYMRDFQVLAVHLHQTVLNTHNANQEEIKLSKRELECLYWAACGKTAEETSIIIGISRRGVRFHIDNILFKLNSVNIAQAVGKAVALELINPSL